MKMANMVIVFLIPKSTTTRKADLSCPQSFVSLGNKGVVHYTMCQLEGRKTNKRQSQKKRQRPIQKKNKGKDKCNNIGKGTPPRAWKKSV